MNKILLIIGICILLIIIGCSSSYKDCVDDCYRIHKDMQIKDCSSGFCINKASDELKELCFNECK